MQEQKPKKKKIGPMGEKIPEFKEVEAPQVDDVIEKAKKAEAEAKAEKEKQKSKTDGLWCGFC